MEFGNKYINKNQIIIFMYDNYIFVLNNILSINFYHIGRLNVGKLPFAVSGQKLADLTILLHKRTSA